MILMMAIDYIKQAGFANTTYEKMALKAPFAKGKKLVMPIGPRNPRKINIPKSKSFIFSVQCISLILIAITDKIIIKMIEHHLA
jgi:hypothetical protein